MNIPFKILFRWGDFIPYEDKLKFISHSENIVQRGLAI
jgi:hypothetical protein